jgi:hypothetical protein
MDLIAIIRVKGVSIDIIKVKEVIIIKEAREHLY